jgi:hypothetical protein
MEMGPAVPASVAGSRKMPEPIMLPTTRAVAIQRPIERLSFGAPSGGAVEADCGGTLIRISSQGSLCSIVPLS